MTKARILLFGALLLTSCHTVRSISISQIPQPGERKQLITADASSPIILAIPFGSGFVDSARDELEEQCRGGEIQGVLSKHEDVEYFFFLVEIQRVTFQAYCLPSRDGHAKGEHRPKKEKT